MTTRWHSRTEYPRTMLGEAIVQANSTTSNLVAAVANTYVDLYALLAYNPTTSNVAVNITDGTNKYVFGAQANAQTTLYLNTVNSPISASNSNTSWTCNTNNTANINLTCLYILNSQ